jgi:hypothetical protein
MVLALEIILNTKSRYIKIYKNKMLEQKIYAKKKFFKDECKPIKKE